MLTRGKVILFYPPYDGPPLGAPLVPAGARLYSARSKL